MLKFLNVDSSLNVSVIKISAEKPCWGGGIISFNKGRWINHKQLQRAILS